MTDHEQVHFLRTLRRMKGAVIPLLEWYTTNHPSVEELREHIDTSRKLTGDAVTDYVAVYLAVAMVGTIGLRPTRHAVHGFMVQTGDGQPVDVDDGPAAAAIGRARMVVAIANSDALAARDVFNAYRRCHNHDAVTEFIADFIAEVSREAAARGMGIRA
jgi:hypothetical protein